MRRKVWFYPKTWRPMEAVAFQTNWLLGIRVLYRDINGKCYKCWAFKDELSNRD